MPGLQSTPPIDWGKLVRNVEMTPGFVPPDRSGVPLPSSETWLSPDGSAAGAVLRDAGEPQIGQVSDFAVSKTCPSSQRRRILLFGSAIFRPAHSPNEPYPPTPRREIALSSAALSASVIFSTLKYPIFWLES